MSKIVLGYKDKTHIICDATNMYAPFERNDFEKEV
jgi:hypothetical protein